MRINIFGNPSPAPHLRGRRIAFLSTRHALAGISDNVKTETLPNGLKVLVLENHKAPVATFHVFYRVGSRNEQTGKTGLAHLLEHLMFRGTKKYKPEEIDHHPAKRR